MLLFSPEMWNGGRKSPHYAKDCFWWYLQSWTLAESGTFCLHFSRYRLQPSRSLSWAFFALCLRQCMTLKSKSGRLSNSGMVERSFFTFHMQNTPRMLLFRTRIAPLESITKRRYTLVANTDLTASSANYLLFRLVIVFYLTSITLTQLHTSALCTGIISSTRLQWYGWWRIRGIISELLGEFCWQRVPRWSGFLAGRSSL